METQHAVLTAVLVYRNYTYTVALDPHLWRQQSNTTGHCQCECCKHPATEQLTIQCTAISPADDNNNDWPLPAVE